VTGNVDGKKNGVTIYNNMSFAGHVMDMIARDRYNRALRQSYRNRHTRMKEALETEVSNHRLHDKKISKEEMQKIKQSIRMSIRRERREALVKTFILTLLVAVILVFLFIRFAFGQVIVSEANRWNVLNTGYPGYLGTETYKIEGDSSYNGQIYKIIWLTYDSVDAGWMYQGLLREEGNKVLYIPLYTSTGEEGLLYDFSLTTGDTCEVVNMFCGDGTVEIIITGIDTVEYFGIERKRWHLKEDYNMQEYWIEGIGSILGPLHTKYYMCIVCPTWDLLCFHHNDTLLFRMPGADRCFMTNVGISEKNTVDDISIYPNPAHDRLTIESLHGYIEKIELFDMLGRKVLEKDYGKNNHHMSLGMDRLARGTYQCHVITENRKITRVIMKR